MLSRPVVPPATDGPGLEGVSGQRLVMGSTTGWVWTSDDAGASWQLLSADLPPVFCVRFG